MGVVYCSANLAFSVALSTLPSGIMSVLTAMVTRDGNKNPCAERILNLAKQPTLAIAVPTKLPACYPIIAMMLRSGITMWWTRSG